MILVWVELKQICKGKLVEPLWPMDYFFAGTLLFDA